MKKKFVKRSEMNHDMVLQITSMADIFTILLVFLLKSFSTGVSNITPSNNVTLPQVSHVDPLVDTMKLEVASNAVMLDDKFVTELDRFQIRMDDLSNTGTSKKLDRALQNQQQKNTLRKLTSLLLLADQNTPYGTLKRLMGSANQAGFTDYRLVVAEEQK